MPTTADALRASSKVDRPTAQPKSKARAGLRLDLARSRRAQAEGKFVTPRGTGTPLGRRVAGSR